MKRATLFLLLLGGPLVAQEFRAVLRQPDPLVDPSQPAIHEVAAFEGGDVRLVVDPLQQKRDFFTGQESSEQQFRLRSRYRLMESATAEWETRGGIQRGGAIGATPAHPAFDQQVVVAQRATLVWKLLDRLQLSGTAQESATQQGARTGTIARGGYGSELSYAIWKEAQVRAGISHEETLLLDEPIVTQDVIHGGFEQKLPWVPLTLASRAARTVKDSDSVLLNTSGQFELSGAWKPEERVGLTGGWQWRSLDSAGSDPGQTVESWFTQLALKPAEILTLTLRTAAETLQIAGATPAPNTQDRFNLTVGTNVKLAEAVTAGFSVRYPLVREEPSARPYFSISASAQF